MTPRRPGHPCHALPPRLLRAYRQTQYAVGAAMVRIGEHSAAADALLARHAAQTAVLLTAWNPGSRRMAEGWNLRMQRALGTCLHGYAIVQAEGTWRTWREAHLLVIGSVPPLIGIARRFRQRAVVVLARRRPALLVPVGPPQAWEAGRHVTDCHKR